MQEALEDRAALQRVRDFGMELNAVQLARLVRHAGDRGRRIAGDNLEAGRQFGDLVAVAHPDIEQPMAFAVGTVLDVFEQGRVAAGSHLGIAKLAHLPAFDLPAELRCHGLHAVADAEHRHAELESRLRRLAECRLRRLKPGHRKG